ncbi:hypothetical protein H7J08_02420 [Mycobacterium frederiksbergense]|uniref:hypothetical protein n=1 Tax=Mycolicibacterium frederiksbergense TaxID=117567 RepID=UPI0021F388D4|nr:hypothetical protein [Mycolicibacterium frederiksbergense]MCV7043532.1 hypothetical protein [Mycolicibacterium frederiksbergense]
MAQHGNLQLLNDAAGLRSYFERDDVQSCGHDVHAAREDAGDVVAAAAVIAASTAAFTVKSDALSDLTTMYFAAESGTAEVSLVRDQTVVTVHPVGHPLGSLLLRHTVGDADTTLIVRRGVDGKHHELAVKGDRCAFWRSETSWCVGDEYQSVAEVIHKFVG